MVDQDGPPRLEGLKCHDAAERLLVSVSTFSGVQRSIHLTHVPLADLGGDLIGAEAGAKGSHSERPQAPASTA